MAYLDFGSVYERFRTVTGSKFTAEMIMMAIVDFIVAMSGVLIVLRQLGLRSSGALTVKVKSPIGVFNISLSHW